MSKAKCIKCGQSAIRPYARAGRTIRYRNIAALLVPIDFPIPTCGHCGSEYFDDAIANELEPILRLAYDAELKQRAQAAISLLSVRITQRRLEQLLGCSQGYLSKLRTQGGQPSAILVSLLVLLSAEPGRLLELERFWSLSTAKPV